VYESVHRNTKLEERIFDKRLLGTRSTFSKSVIVSVGMSTLESTELIFLETGVEIIGAYYREVLGLLGQNFC